MFKVLVLVSCIAAFAFAHPPFPTAEEAKKQLVDAGVSETAADEIVKIGEKHKEEFAKGKDDKEAARAAFETMKTEVDEYLKTQSEADQQAYEKFVEAKKQEFHDHHKQE
ncbi:unnamed protein product [Caenorhabditis bovis]|uniref:SXP/RAL-2 family protein Ani s 5-like cation-binding domain-containing protein n=1 Tax=Caenorhabditis bovis TaxID=2654633 RepID=A0A8S1E2H4_9PELO|nr:unnamed protein product [Caenorhabditis bovis]